MTLLDSVESEVEVYHLLNKKLAESNTQSYIDYFRSNKTAINTAGTSGHYFLQRISELYNESLSWVDLHTSFQLSFAQKEEIFFQNEDLMKQVISYANPTRFVHIVLPTPIKYTNFVSSGLSSHFYTHSQHVPIENEKLISNIKKAISACVKNNTPVPLFTSFVAAQFYINNYNDRSKTLPILTFDTDINSAHYHNCSENDQIIDSLYVDMKDMNTMDDTTLRRIFLKDFRIEDSTSIKFTLGSVYRGGHFFPKNLCTNNLAKCVYEEAVNSHHPTCVLQ